MGVHAACVTRTAVGAGEYAGVCVCVCVQLSSVLCCAGKRVSLCAYAVRCY